MPATEVVTNSGEAVALSGETVQGFAASLRGELVRPDDDGYEDARKVYNGMHDRRPALIVQAAGVADVIGTVMLAAERDIMLAVRGGAHSVPGFGTCDGGVVLDLGRMKGIRVDPDRRTVRAEGGCTWGDFNHATHAFGLATPGGVVSTTGIAGLTLGGGIGYLSRAFGLSCDNLVSADVVTADGTFVTCSDEREPELFWAIRGGGGNFGVVTSFEFNLHPVAEIFGGVTVFPLDSDVLGGYRQLISEAPEELGAVLGLTVAPPLPFLPEQWHGKPIAAVVSCWVGSLEGGERVHETFADWAPVVGAQVGRMPYPVINTLFDELLPAGLYHYWKANFARELTDEAIDAHVEHAARTPCPESGTFIMPVDGACHRVEPDETAYSYRDATFSNVISGAWPSAADSDRNVDWVREYHTALEPHSEEGGYVNFMSADDQDRVRANYRQNYTRLTAAKARYDPDNLFRVNQNIHPAR